MNRAAARPPLSLRRGVRAVLGDGGGGCGGAAAGKKRGRGVVYALDDENVGEPMLSRGRVAGSRALENPLRRSRTARSKALPRAHRACTGALCVETVISGRGAVRCL